MLRKIGPFVIQRPQGDEIEEAKLFCNLAYEKEGNISEHSTIFPDDFFTIRNDGELKGTMGVYTEKNLGGQRFPTEEAFDFNLVDLGIDPSRTSEIARLSGNGQIFVPFVAWVGEFMVEELDLRHVLLGEKPYVEVAQRKMGLPTQIQSQLKQPVAENIPKEFRPYFEKPPTPIVVIIDLLEALPICKAHIARFDS